jgi:hypothetical protein
MVYVLLHMHALWHYILSPATIRSDPAIAYVLSRAFYRKYLLCVRYEECGSGKKVRSVGALTVRGETIMY